MKYSLAKTVLIATCIWLVAIASIFAQGPKPVTPQEFEQLHSALDPQGAQWQTIPWEISLVKAQNLALRDGKPIFIWSMDGHPLGCT